MGYGEYTGNQSVHWSVVHHGGADACAIRGRDPIKFEQIGDASRGLTPGNFRVRLRFGTQAEAEEALRSVKIEEKYGSVFLVFDVPAVNRPKEKVEPADPPSEIRVDW
jgi:hypothetical protein